MRKLNALATLAALAALATLTSCGGGAGATGGAPRRLGVHSAKLGDAQAPQASRGSPLPHAPLATMVGQQLIVAMNGLTPDAALLRRIYKGQAGGVFLSGPNISSPRQVAALVRKLQASAKAGANPPLLIATDQEGGEVKRLPWAPPALTPTEMGRAGAAVSRAQGRATGGALRALGINVNLAPVLDVARSPSVFIWRQGRAFGMDPTTVIDSAVPFATGLQSAGVAATAKHYPGIGGAGANTDYTLDTISERPEDLLPYRAAIGAGVALIMVSTAVYPNLDPSRHRAALSQPIITGLLRGYSGYRGTVITDDVEEPTAQATGEAAVAAAAAGADIVLVSSTENGGPEAYRALLAAARAGRLRKPGIGAAYARIQALKRAYAHP